MSSDTQEPRPYSFVIGMLTGTAIGVGLATWLASPSVPQFRTRVIDLGKGVANGTGQQHQHARTDLSQTAEDLAQRARGVRDNIAEAVAHRAREVEVYATARRDRAARAKRLSSANPATSTLHSAQGDEHA